MTATYVDPTRYFEVYHEARKLGSKDGGGVDVTATEDGRDGLLVGAVCRGARVCLLYTSDAADE